MENRQLRPRLKRRAASREVFNGRRFVVAEGMRQSPWADLYHTAMVVSWPRFLSALAAAFVLINMFFAALYSFGGNPIANARPGHFDDLFFFSVETISTTGYGDMHPQTTYGHVVATVEIFASLLATAAMTGLVFARFARPRARLVFARHPVVQPHDGVDTLMLRVVNARDSFITEATVKLWMLGPSVSAEGRRFVGFRPMRLLRSENPAFALSWTLFHPIDAESPLYGKSMDEAILEGVNIVVSITGLDETSLQLVHARHVYAAEDLRWGHEFVDMFARDADGQSRVDLTKVHETQLVVSRTSLA